MDKSKHKAGRVPEQESFSESQQLLTSSINSPPKVYGSRRPMEYASINSSTDDLESSVRNAAILSRYKYYSRLASHSNSIMAIPDHVVPAEFWSHLPITPVGKQSSLITIFSIWNTMMGTSLLSMPWALGQAGFGLGLSLMIIMAILTLYTSYRVMKSVDTIDRPTGGIIEFSDVCKHYLGRPGEMLAVFCSVITLIGGATVYWVLMSNFLFNVVNFVHNNLQPGTHYDPYEANYTMYHDHYIHCTKPIKSSKVFTHSTTAPTHAEEEFHMYWDLQKSVPCYLALLLALLVNFKSPTFFTKFNALDASSKFPALTGVLFLAYFIHNCVLSIVRNQEKPENNGRDLTIAFVCVAFTYCYVAVMFYGAWPMISKHCIDENFLNNFLPEDVLAFIARIFLFLQMLTVFPLLLYIMRIQVMHALFGSVWPSWKHVSLLNIVVFGVCMAIARYYPHIGSIIRYVGSFCGLMYAFFLPCATYILYNKYCKTLSILKIIFHVVLVVIGIANFVAQFFI